MNEAKIQAFMCQWLNHVLPMGTLFHHSPNEGRRHVSFRVKLKKMGFRAGWPDLEIFTQPTNFNENITPGAIFIEVKGEKGRLSAAQKDVHTSLASFGCYVGVCTSITTCKDFLAPLLSLRHTPQSQIIHQMEQSQWNT